MRLAKRDLSRASKLLGSAHLRKVARHGRRLGPDDASELEALGLMEPGDTIADGLNRLHSTLQKNYRESTYLDLETSTASAEPVLWPKSPKARGPKRGHPALFPNPQPPPQQAHLKSTVASPPASSPAARHMVSISTSPHRCSG